MPSLRITVYDACGLPEKMNLLDRTDPFVVLQLGLGVEKTNVKKNAGASASWNQVFTMCYGNEPQLLVYVKEQSSLKSDTVIASGSLDLTRGILSSGNWSGPVHLVPAKGLEKKCNTPHVNLQVVWQP